MGSDALQYVLIGLSLSSYYALFAVGLSLVFGVMKVINFAHGELFMLGAYIVFLVFSFGQGSMPAPLLFFFAVLAAAMAIGTWRRPLPVAWGSTTRGAQNKDC